MVDLNELRNRIMHFFAEADQKREAEAYRKVAALLSEYSGKLRDHALQATTDRIQSVIHKLQTAEDIDEAEKELIRLAVMGNADDFARQEVCAGELERLRRELDACWGGVDDPAVVVRIGGLFEEITRVIFALSEHMERRVQRERFDQTLRDLTIEDRELLIEILKNKIKPTAAW